MKILIVDDDKMFRMYIGAILKNKGHTTIQVDGVEKCIEKFVAAHEGDDPFDFVLLDIHMPTHNGTIALQYIRDLEKEYDLEKTPIAIVTAGPDNMGHFSLLKDADHIIIKDVNIEKNLDKILNKHI